MKKFTLILCIFFAASAVSFSNIVISGKHKDKIKDGKKVDCSYCHFTGAKIPQKKGMFKDNLVNGVSRAKIKECAGKECHN